MKVIFENKFGLKEKAINIPFMIENTPIGVVTEVNEYAFTVEIWDQFCGYEYFNIDKPVSVYFNVE